MQTTARTVDPLAFTAQQDAFADACATIDPDDLGIRWDDRTFSHAFGTCSDGGWVAEAEGRLAIEWQYEGVLQIDPLRTVEVNVCANDDDRRYNLFVEVEGETEQLRAVRIRGVWICRAVVRWWTGDAGNV